MVKSPARHRQREGEHTLGAEAEVGVHHPDERVHRHAAAGEQRQRQRELDDHQRAPQPMTPAADRSAALLHRLARGSRASACQAGAQPASMPATAQTPSANSSTGTLSAISVSDGSVYGGISATMASSSTADEQRAERAAGERDDQALDEQLP